MVMFLQLLANKYRYLFLVMADLNLDYLNPLHAILTIWTHSFYVVIANDILLERHVNSVHWHKRVLVVDGQLTVFCYNVFVNRIYHLRE